MGELNTKTASCVKNGNAATRNPGNSSVLLPLIGAVALPVLIGFFASRQVSDEANGIFIDPKEGLSLLTGQVVAVLVTIVFSVVATLILLKIIDSIVGLRVNSDDEVRGLDVSEHGEEGYIFNR